jgi:death on curing protein
MKAAPRWISGKALLLLHEESIAGFGGARGIANAGLLDSALARPLHAWHYKAKTTIPDLAASRAYGLVRNHPFVDGNKRVAFLAIGVFLAINGWRLVADQADAIETIFALAAGDLDERHLAAWIAAHSLPAARPKKR